MGITGDYKEITVKLSYRTVCMYALQQLWYLNNFLSQLSIHSAAGEAMVRWGQRLLFSIPPWLQPKVSSQMLRAHVYSLHPGK